jgi:hypothetical protein
MRHMTGDPGERDDILGFGQTDRAPRAFRLGIRLDRLTLRVTRRPRLVAVAAGLVVLAVAAGGAVAYLGPARSVARSPGLSGHCSASSQSNLAAAAITSFLKQLRQGAPNPSSPGTPDLSLPYSSGVTVVKIEATPVAISVFPGMGQSPCP